MKPTESVPQEHSEVQRQHAEQQFAEELAALAAADDRPRPPNWKLSPWAVRTYLLGGKLADGFEVQPKYIGNARLIEIAVATLATDRALLLLGVPGTAKTWVSEHLAAAISGDSTLLVQGTAGTDEEAIRYGWNYARLLAEGPSAGALVPSPMMRAMRDGQDRARRGADAHPGRGAGHADHHPVGEDAARPRAGHRGAGARGLQRHRHGQQPRPGRERAVERAASAASTPSCCPARHDRRGGRDRRPARVASLGRALELPAEAPALEEIRRRGHHLPRAAQRRDRRRQDQAQVAERHAVDGRGDLGRQQRPGPGGATSATACCAPPTSPPA